MMRTARRKRWLRLLLWAAVALPLALFVVLTGYLLFGDVDPPEDSDLLARRVVAKDENGWRFIDFAPGAVWWPPGPKDPTEMISDNGLWDQALADELFAKNAAAIESLDRALARKNIVAPSPDPAVLNPGHLMAWQGLVYVLELRSLSRLRQGSVSGAADDALRIVRFAQAVKSAELPMIDYMCADSLEALGWSRLHGVITSTDNPAILDDIRAEVRALEPRPEWLIDTVRAEYQFAVQWIDTHGRESVPDFVGRLLFQPNRTKAKLAAQCRATIERLRGGDFAGIEPISRPLPSWIDASSVSRGITAQGIRTCALRERAHHRLTRTLIALRLYRLEKGELPANLEDLVPRHLESVPVDPYDGQPIRYSRELRRVYCVGDMTDREWLLAPRSVQEDLGVAIEF